MGPAQDPLEFQENRVEKGWDLLEKALIECDIPKGGFRGRDQPRLPCSPELIPIFSGSKDFSCYSPAPALSCSASLHPQ